MEKIKGQIYKCAVCGNVVELTFVGGGELVCCGQPMELLKEKGMAEEGKEKHVPVIERTSTGYKVKVGSVPHPMEAGHHIAWIEIIADGKTYRQDLEIGSEPVAEFCIQAEKVSARAYCNIHGLWKS
jgi:superoxide reductase